MAVKINGSTGVTFEDNDKQNWGTGNDLQIYHDGNHSRIVDAGTGVLALQGTTGVNILNTDASESMVTCTANGSVDLYYDNAKVLETTSTGAKVSSSATTYLQVVGGEGGSASLNLTPDEGDDNADEVRLITNDGGQTYLQNKASGSWETNLLSNPNGNIELYYDNSKKFETTSTGVTVTGTLTADGYAGLPTSNRNLIINGAMQVAQRGTSFADPADNAYTLDRWKTRNSSGDPAFTWTKDSESPPGFGSSLKCDCTTADTSLAAGDFHRLEYHIEGQDLQSLAKGTASAKKSVLSFYVKTDKTGVYTVNLYDGDNGEYWAGSYTVSNTNWNRYTLSVPADTSGAYDNDNGDSLTIAFGLAIGSSRNSGDVNDLPATWGGSGATGQFAGQVNFADSTSNNWYITGVQYEVDHSDSGTATDFEHRLYGDELMRCYRYFYMHADGSQSQWQNIGLLAAWTAGSEIAIVSYPTRMRTSPSLYKVVGTDYFRCSRNNGYQDSDDVGFDTSGGSMMGYLNFTDDIASSGGMAGTAQIANQSAARIGFDAEI